MNFHILEDGGSAATGSSGLPSTLLSISAHAGIVCLLIALPLLTHDSLPEPAPMTLRAFLVAPSLAPAPPPPPPPAPAALPTVPQAVAKPTPTTFQAPVEVPRQVEPDAGQSLGVEGGMPGGVEGGVPGGVVGGVVGGLADSPMPATPRVVRVGGAVKEPTKLKNVSPAYPEVAVASRIEGTVVLEATIAPNGKVAEVRVLHSLPLLEKAAVDAVKQWVYSPTLIDGVPVTAIMTVTVRFQLT
jgi:periplasmic protein TonB